jgi:hypothetical protein
MPRYSLRTLLIVLALGLVLIAWCGPAVYEFGWYLEPRDKTDLELGNVVGAA